MKHKWICMVFVVAVTSCASTEVQPASDELTPLQKGYALTKIAYGSVIEGEGTSALITLKEAEQYAPKLPMLHHVRALAYYTKKDLNGALTSALTALALDPKYSSAKNTVGKIYFDMQQFSNAKKYLEDAAADPLFREAYKARTTLGLIYFKQKKFNQAQYHFRRAIQDQPKKACVAYLYRGKIFFKQNQFEKAEDEYLSATRQLCANYPEAFYSLGMAYLRTKKFDQARRTFLKVNELFPKSKYAEISMNRLKDVP